MVPRHTSTRPAVALALAAAALVALSSCRRAERPAPAPVPVQPPAAAAPVPPLGPVERAQLISAAASASDAYALGRPYPPALADLIGERFEARLPFGCAGEAPEADVGYTVDAKRGALSLQARPETWTTTPWVRALAGPAPIEAIEGFWLRRPWISSDACPAIRAPASAAPAPATPETLGLARLFPPGESRVLRHGARGYEVVKKIEPGLLRVQGFRLVLAGRIADFGDRQPIRCRSEGPDQRPACLVAVEFDRVSFEDPVSGQVLAEWRN